MCETVDVVYRQRFCGGPGCGAVFYICRSCDRGHRYCNDSCRKKARRLQRQQANRKHQQSLEGRLDHRDRQRRWRELQLRRVTDQGRGPVKISATIPPPQFGRADEGRKIEECGLIVCIVCGRHGNYIEIFYRSG